MVEFQTLSTVIGRVRAGAIWRCLITLLLLTLSTYGTRTASADGINVRPVVPQVSVEPSLQSVFDDLTVSGPGIDATNDQIYFGWFNPAASRGVATVVIRLAGLLHNALGIYDVSDPSKTATLFAPFASQGDLTTVTFLDEGVRVTSAGVENFYAGNYSTFGFWLNIVIGVGDKVYSDDDLNRGDPFAIAFRGDDATTLNLPGVGDTLFSSRMVLLGWEDWTGGDDDFQDFVIAMQGVVPINGPELPGDTNGDSTVDLDDLNNVRNNFGLAGEGVIGDTNGDQLVGLADLNYVRNFFGRTATQQVPEPSSLFMMGAGASGLAACGCILRKRQHAHTSR